MMRINGARAKTAAFCICPIIAGCSFLEETMPGITLSDANVVRVLQSLDQGEIDAAQLAQEQAAAPEVKAFAARVLKEHRELAQANGRLAGEIGLEPQTSLLASQLRQAHEDEMRTLRGTTGPAFDRAYVEYEIRQHIRAFHFVEAAADSEATPQLQQELVRTGPDLLSHISAARALERHLPSGPPHAVAAR